MAKDQNEQEEIDRDLDLFQVERDWRKGDLKLDWVKPVVGSIPKEEAQWLNIFPQAKKQYGKLIKGKLKIEKKYLVKAQEEIRQEAIHRIKENTPDAAWRDTLIKEWRDRELSTCQKRIRTIEALLALTGRTNKPAKPGQQVIITPEMIQRAKEYPLEKLVEIKRGFTKCFAHDDSKPSAYCKGNFIHCFVCQKQWDTIAVLMERDGMKFREAVLKLQ